MKKRILSILLALCMVLMLVPATVFAEDRCTFEYNFKYGSYQSESGNSDTSPYTCNPPVPDEVMLGTVINCAPYKFVGWKETGSGTVYAPPSTAVANGDMTFEALYEVDGSLAVTVDGFEVGKTPADCTFSFASTIPGVTFSADDIQYIYWEKYVFNEAVKQYQWLRMDETEVFQAGTQYILLLCLDNKGLELAPAVTMNGKTPENCTIATRDGVPIQLQIYCELGTPKVPVYNLDITVDGFVAGNTPKDITLSFASTIPGVTFGKDDIKSLRWSERIDNADWPLIEDTDVFRAGISYNFLIQLDNKGLGTAPAVTINGKTPEYCDISFKDGVPVMLRILCELGTPDVAVNAPFTITVDKGDAAEPGETEFALGLFDGSGNELTFGDTSFTAVITTDGVGSYSGNLAVTATESWLRRMLQEGAFIKQYDGGENGWTYDDTVYGVFLKQSEVASRADGEVVYYLAIYPTYLTEDGERSVDFDAPAEKMTFTNTYTAHDYRLKYNADGHWDECTGCKDKQNEEPHRYGDWKVITAATRTADGAKERVCSVCDYIDRRIIPMTGGTVTQVNGPATGYESRTALWCALLFIGGAGIIGTAHYGKKKSTK
ncbi:MAG: hypothetical protein PUB11_01835 [Oscillospiraceae bacterium]|nr:hypothetical protein [Oscillospiraceae bacterium]